MKFLIVLLTIIVLPFYAAQAQSQSGMVTGIVMDGQSKFPLFGVHIIIEDSQTVTVSNSEGRFELQNLEAGIYNIRFQYLGYRTFIQTDVVVRNHRSTDLEIQLFPAPIEGEGVIVRPSYYVRDAVAPVSRVGFNAEEIRRSPGAGQELSRVIMAAPGVAAHGDTSQDLLVRGGSPSENGFYIDHIPVPGVNHFERQNGSTAGPIGIVNTELVSQLDFYSGGFSPKFGNHSSSVIDIRYREGSRDQFQGSFEVSMAGFGLIAEHPFAEGNGSVLFSARRSYLDLIASAIDAGGAPQYGDVQIKAVYDVNSSNRITILNIYGDSLFESDWETAWNEGFDQYGSSRNKQHTTGLNWRRMIGSKMISNTSLSYSTKQDQTDFYWTDERSIAWDFNIRNQFVTLRNTNYLFINDHNRMEFGFQAQYRSGDYDYFSSAFTNEAGIERPEFRRNLLLDEQHAGGFAAWTVQPRNQLSLTLGGRLDYNSLNQVAALSPRGSFSWQIAEKLALNGSAGVYRQSQPLFFRSQSKDFETLKDFKTTQAVLGLDYQLTPDTRLTVEAYEKQYRNLLSLPQGHNMGGEFFVLESELFFDELEDRGRSYARGIELMVQKKLTKQFYGMVSGSLFRTQFRDSKGDWQSRSFDVKTIFNVIGGYRPNDRYEFSVRWSYIGSRPFTPVDEIASNQAGTTVLDIQNYHRLRMPPYHSLFTRFDRRWFLNRMSITTFIEVWNAYNRQNVELYYWNVAENQVSDFNQFSTLPIGGVKIEF